MPGEHVVAKAARMDGGAQLPRLVGVDRLASRAWPGRRSRRRFQVHLPR